MKLKSERTPNGTDVEIGSGNVFADLGLPDADELYLKAQLSTQLRRLIDENGLTQAAAAKLLGITQPKMNDILRGRLKGFSAERLLGYVNRLGYSVEVRIAKRRTPEKAATRVRVA